MIREWVEIPEFARRAQVFDDSDVLDDGADNSDTGNTDQKASTVKVEIDESVARKAGISSPDDDVVCFNIDLGGFSAVVVVPKAGETAVRSALQVPCPEGAIEVGDAIAALMTLRKYNIDANPTFAAEYDDIEDFSRDVRALADKLKAARKSQT